MDLICHRRHDFFVTAFVDYEHSVAAESDKNQQTQGSTHMTFLIFSLLFNQPKREKDQNTGDYIISSRCIYENV